jgi:hypothetical protein
MEVDMMLALKQRLQKDPISISGCFSVSATNTNTIILVYI